MSEETRTEIPVEKEEMLARRCIAATFLEDVFPLQKVLGFSNKGMKHKVDLLSGYMREYGIRQVDDAIERLDILQSRIQHWRICLLEIRRKQRTELGGYRPGKHRVIEPPWSGFTTERSRK